MQLARIRYEHRYFNVAPALDFEVVQKDGFYHIDIPELGISADGENETAALQEMAEDLAFVWDTYALEKDENLTQDARELKEALLKRALEVRVCSLCNGNVRPQSVFFALEDAAGNWYHLTCLKKNLPQLLQEKQC